MRNRDAKALKKIVAAFVEADQKQMHKRFLDLGPPLHARNEKAVQAMGGYRWFSTKESEIDRICQVSRGQRVLVTLQKAEQLQANITITFLIN